MLVSYSPSSGLCVSLLPGRWRPFSFEHIEISFVSGVPELVGFSIVQNSIQRTLGDEIRRRGMKVDPPTVPPLQPITPALLSSAPVALIVSAVVARPDLMRQAAERSPVLAFAVSTLGELDERLAVIPERPRGGSDEFSAAVAAAVRKARAIGQPIDLEVAAVFNVSRYRAKEYVREAKDRGQLPERMTDV